MSNIIDSIQLSGSSYDVRDKSATTVVEVTQAEYDVLPSSAKTDTSKMYVITDAQAGDLTNYYTKTETNTLLAGKQATLVSGTNIKTINNESILGSGNIDIQGGGGKSIEGGRGISVTTGETADTVSFNLPISAGTSSTSIKFSTYSNEATGGCSVSFNGSDFHPNRAYGYCSFVQGEETKACTRGSHAEGYGTTAGDPNNSDSKYTHAEGYFSKSYGQYSHAEGENTSALTYCSHTEGRYTIANNSSEHASGSYNVSNTGSTDADKTLFSVGNGTSNNARHNAFEIRQNGDIYLSSGSTDIKLQDYLGGGGGTVESAITSGSTNAVESKAIWSAVTYDVSINETLEFDNTYTATNYPSGCNSVIFEHNTGGTLPIGDYVFTSGGSEVAKLTCAVISWWPMEVGWTSSDPKLTYVVAEGNSAVTASYSELAGDIDGVTVPSTFTSAYTATASGENHLWINENTYRKDEVYNKSEINVLSGIVDTKLDATAYTPTVCDSTLNMVSTNPVQNKALYDELRIDGGTALVFDENNFSTNYPNGCTKIKVEVVGSSNWSSIDFYNDNQPLGNITINNWGSISVDVGNFQGSTYEISGTTVIISYPTVTNVTKIQVTGTGNYAYKAVTTEATTALKDQVVANTTALGGLSLIKLTESEYTALVNKDANTLYVVTPDPNS